MNMKNGEIIKYNTIQLQEYLKLLKGCPADKLDDELGVYDNMVILLQIDFENVKKHFHENYNFQEIFGIKYIFWHRTYSVRLDLMPEVAPEYFSVSDEKKYEELRRDYNATITLHPPGIKHGLIRLISGHPLKDLALVVEELAEYIQKEKIPSCIPFRRTVCGRIDKQLVIQKYTE